MLTVLQGNFHADRDTETETEMELMEKSPQWSQTRPRWHLLITKFRQHAAGSPPGHMTETYLGRSCSPSSEERTRTGQTRLAAAAAISQPIRLSYKCRSSSVNILDCPVPSQHRVLVLLLSLSSNSNPPAFTAFIQSILRLHRPPPPLPLLSAAAQS